MLFFAGLTLDLDITYLLVLGLLLLPLLILNGLVFKPFSRLFEERHEQLEGALVRAAHRLKEAESKGRAFEAKMQVAAERGVQIRNDIRAIGQKEANDRIEAERVKMTGKLNEALERVTKTKNTALADVGAQAQRLAELAAARLLGRGA